MGNYANCCGHLQCLWGGHQTCMLDLLQSATVGGRCVIWLDVLQVAFQQADYVAWNLWSAINSRPLLPFKYQHLGDMMSLGTVRALQSRPLPANGSLSDLLRSLPVAVLFPEAAQECADNAVQALCFCLYTCTHCQCYVAGLSVRTCRCTPFVHIQHLHVSVVALRLCVWV